MTAQNYADKWAGYINVDASTVTTGLVNKIYTYGSLKLNSTGAQIWSDDRTVSGNGAGEYIRYRTTSYYGNKVAFYTTHDVIHTTSSTIYLVNTVN